MFSTFRSKLFGGVSSVFGLKDETRKKSDGENASFSSTKHALSDLTWPPYEPSTANTPDLVNGIRIAAVPSSKICPSNAKDKSSHVADRCSLSSIFISKDAVELCDVVGSGQFGDVFRGVYQGKPVAIKVSACTVLDDIRSSTEQRELAQKLVHEAEAMGRLQHKHIIQLIGLCCSEPVWLVMEFAPLGQLRSYLHSHRNQIDRKLLFEYCTQIAEALVYLSECNVLHRDIAARNVLVVEKNLVKLADFGLSRALIDESSYYKMSGGKLPIKWLAPESISHRRFTHASDVWMFAVCMWEIFKLGEKPFVTVKNADVLALLERGGRLSKPEACPLRMYNLWTLCWSYDPSQRPKIEKIKQSLDSIYADGCVISLSNVVGMKQPVGEQLISVAHETRSKPVDVFHRRGRLLPLTYNSATLQPLSNVHRRSDDNFASHGEASSLKRRTLTLEEIQSYGRQKKLFKELSCQIRQQLFDQTLHEQKLQAEEDDEWLDEQQRRFLSPVEVDGDRQAVSRSPICFSGASVADRKPSMLLSHLLSGSQARQTQISVTTLQTADLSRDIIRLTNDVCCNLHNEEPFTADKNDSTNTASSSDHSTCTTIKTLGLSVASLSAHIDALVEFLSSAAASQSDTVPTKNKPNSRPLVSADSNGDAERRLPPELITQIRDTQANLSASMKLVIEATTLLAKVTNATLDADNNETDADDDRISYVDNLAIAVRLVAVETRRLLHLVLKKNRLVDFLG